MKRLSLNSAASSAWPLSRSVYTLLIQMCWFISCHISPTFVKKLYAHTGVCVHQCASLCCFLLSQNAPKGFMCILL